MKKSAVACTLIILIVSIVSCQKEIEIEGFGPANIDSALIGKWKFVSMSVSSEVTDELNDGTESVKTITSSDYVTTNNKGSVIIDSKTMTVKDLSYDLETIVTVDYYSNNAYVETFLVPLTYSIPTSNYSSNYKRIGTDSLNFPGGALIMAEGETTGIDFAPGGYKYLLSDENHLTLVSILRQEDKQYNNGISRKITRSALLQTILEK